MRKLCGSVTAPGDAAWQPPAQHNRALGPGARRRHPHPHPSAAWCTKLCKHNGGVPWPTTTGVVPLARGTERHNSDANNNPCAHHV